MRPLGASTIGVHVTSSEMLPTESEVFKAILAMLPSSAMQMSADKESSDSEPSGFKE